MTTLARILDSPFACKSAEVRVEVKCVVTCSITSDIEDLFDAISGLPRTSITSTVVAMEVSINLFQILGR